MQRCEVRNVARAHSQAVATPRARTTSSSNTRSTSGQPLTLHESVVLLDLHAQQAAEAREVSLYVALRGAAGVLRSRRKRRWSLCEHERFLGYGRKGFVQDCRSGPQAPSTSHLKRPCTVCWN